MTLRLRGIHKHYGDVRANDGVDLDVARGELHGVLGENGAGKSTLMKVLSGFVRADAGTVELDGRPLALGSPRAATAAGIGMLHQDPLVFGPFSVLDNFLLASHGTSEARAGRPRERQRAGRRWGPGAQPPRRFGGARLDRRRGERQLRDAASRYGFTFDPDAPARSLTVGERQQLEIARLLWLGARVLIFDEPTTGISADQRDKLFAVLRQLSVEGLIVLFVSHKLEEVEQLCQRVTIMRRGRVVGREDMPVPAQRLVEQMFGDIAVDEERPAPVAIGDPVLRLAGASFSERIDIHDVTLDVGAGEVLGIAGMEGGGQRPLLRGCAGMLRPTGGTITFDGRDLTRGRHGDFLAGGAHLLPAGRLEEGLVPGMTITEHFELVSGNRAPFVDWGVATAAARTNIAAAQIHGAPDSMAEALSGGNQQRLLLAMLPERLRLLLMEHPTRGLDLESAAWVWGRLLERREHGTAIVFASADLDELLRYSDRIAVVFAGRVIAVVDAATTTPDELGHLIGGRLT